MIVSDKNVSDALSYLAIDPHPLALARKDVVDGENKSKEIFYRVFLDATGPVEARKATAETYGGYIVAKEEEAQAIMELERHRARVKAAEMLISVFQTESKNAREAERIR